MKTYVVQDKSNNAAVKAVTEDDITPQPPKSPKSPRTPTKGTKSPKSPRTPAKGTKSLKTPTKKTKSPTAGTPKSTAKRTPATPAKGKKGEVDGASQQDLVLTTFASNTPRPRRMKNLPPAVVIPLEENEGHLSESMRNKQAAGKKAAGKKNGKKRARSGSQEPRRSKRTKDAASSSGGGASSSTTPTTQAGSSSANVQSAEQEGQMCPIDKVQSMCWYVPFLLLLDIICEAPTDIQELYLSFLPSAEQLGTGARNTVYGVIERSLGKTLSELSTHLSMEFQAARTARENVPIFRQAKKTFELKYMEGLALLKNIRKAIGSQPSIYWFYCPKQ